MTKKIMMFIMTIFMASKVAYADCTYQEQSDLKSKASNIKVSYEVDKYELEMDDYPLTVSRFAISILNVTDDFFVVVTNSIDNSEKTYDSKDAEDGIVTFYWENDEELTNFTFKVYSSGNTNCPNYLYKTLYLTTPRFNQYSRLEICQDEPDFYLCKEYITTETVSKDTFYNQLDKYLNKEINENGDAEEEQPSEEENSSKILEFIKKYKLFILGGVVVIIAAGGVIIYIKTKKRGGSKL